MRGIARLALPLLLWALGGAPCAAFAAEPGADWGLPQLMAEMRQVRSASARFVERKQMRVLNQPLQSSGRLIYVAPNRLQKETLAPAHSRLTVNGDLLTVQQPGGNPRDLALSDYPEIGALVESIRATLSGDLATLTRYYDVTLAGGAPDWSLQLEPREQRIRELVKVIRIRGDGHEIRSIETLESGGDRTEMTIAPDAG